MNSILHWKKEFFTNSYSIYSADGKIGQLNENPWKIRATVTYIDQSFHWQYDNLWQSRWSLTDYRGLKVDFQGGLHKGTIEGLDISEFHIIAGLFITNYYVQTSIVIFIAIFVPIIASISN